MSFSPLQNVGIDPRLKAIYDNNQDEYKDIEEDATKWLLDWVKRRVKPTQAEYAMLVKRTRTEIRLEYDEIAAYVAKTVTPDNCSRDELRNMQLRLERAVHLRRENKDIWQASGKFHDAGHNQWIKVLKAVEDEFEIAVIEFDRQVEKMSKKQETPAPSEPSNHEPSGIMAYILRSRKAKNKAADEEKALKDQGKATSKTQTVDPEQENSADPSSEPEDFEGGGESEQANAELLEAEQVDQSHVQDKHMDRQEAGDDGLGNEQIDEDQVDEGQIDEGQIEEDQIEQDRVEEDRVEEDLGDEGQGDKDQGDEDQIDEGQSDEDGINEEQTNQKKTQSKQSMQQPGKLHTRNQKRKEEKKRRHEEGKAKQFVPKDEAERQERTQRKKNQKERRKERKRLENELEAEALQAKEREEQRKQEALKVELERQLEELERQKWKNKLMLFICVCACFTAGIASMGIVAVNKDYSLPQ